MHYAGDCGESSDDFGVDPFGTCVGGGFGGVREVDAVEGGDYYSEDELEGAQGDAGYEAAGAGVVPVLVDFGVGRFHVAIE